MDKPPILKLEVISLLKQPEQEKNIPNDLTNDLTKDLTNNLTKDKNIEPIYSIVTPKLTLNIISNVSSINLSNINLSSINLTNIPDLPIVNSSKITLPNISVNTPVNNPVNNPVNSSTTLQLVVKSEISTIKDPYGFGFEINPKLKKVDLETYRKVFEKGYRCLTPYINSRDCLEIICDKGHIEKIKAIKARIPCKNCTQCWDINEVDYSEKTMMIIKAWGGSTTDYYINTNTPINISCINNHKFSIIPKQILCGCWCSYCSGKSADCAKEKFETIVKEKGGTILEGYISAHQNIKIQCNKGHIFTPVAASINRGRWCQQCCGNTLAAGEESFKQHVAAKGGIIIDTKPYAGKSVKMKMRCKNGHIFETTPDCVRSGHFCRRCVGLCPEQAKENMHKRIEELNATLLSPYVKSSLKVKIICAAGHTFEITPNHMTDGKWCRLCGMSESHGERAVRLYLNKKLPTVEISLEKRFDWLITKKYDFYFVHNNINYLIEFDGIQHFEFIKLFHTNEQNFLNRRQVDITKTEMAIINGYVLIRIAYTDIDEVEEILDEILVNNNLDKKLYLSDPEMYTWLIEAMDKKITY